MVCNGKRAKRRRLGQKFDRETPRAECRRLSAAFREPPAERQDFLRACDDSDNSTPPTSHSDDIGRTLWHMSSGHWPSRPDAARAVEVFSVAQDRELPVHSSRVGLRTGAGGRSDPGGSGETSEDKAMRV